MIRFASKRVSLGLACLTIALAGCVHTASLPPRAVYVAMGSSFAAGPGVTDPADTPPNRCARSKDNYPRQLARLRNLQLIDVSCNAATTANVLKGQGDLPPQINALKPDTRLVTITIGGNDVGYMGGLIAASCRQAAGQDQAAAAKCNSSFEPTEQNWMDVEHGMDSIIAEVRKRSPTARLIFVDYLTAVPEQGSCAALPLPPGYAAKSRAIAGRLVDVTARAARRGGADILQASTLSRDHSICSKVPWSREYVPLNLGGGRADVPFHPNLAGMTGIANALDRMLRR